MTATLIIQSIFFQKINPKIKKIIVDKEEYEYQEEKKITLKFNDIESEIGIKVVKIILILQNNNEEEHFFEIMKGTTIYGYLLPESGKTLDIILNEKINCPSQIKDNYSNTSTYLEIKDNRLLIFNLNFNYMLSINNEDITRKFLYLGENSIQISIPALKDKIYFYKNVDSLDYDAFFKLFDGLKNKANNFFLKVNSKLLNNEAINEKFFKDYSDLLKGCNTKINLPKNILNKMYNKIEYFNFISNCCLYSILSDIEINEIKNIFNFFITFKTNLENDKNVKYYLKCIIINDFAVRLNKYKNVSEFRKLNYKYYINDKHLENNSPLKSALLALEKFKDNLNESSPFFYPLILIDSEKYNYKPNYGTEKEVFGYGLTSSDLLKKHLNEIIPEVIIAFNDENYYKDDQGSTNKRTGAITLNLSCKLLSGLKEYDLSKKIDDTKVLNDLSLRIYIVLFHETYGHKKGGYSFRSDDLLLSPNYFYDKKKEKIMKLDYMFSSSNRNVIKILHDPNTKSDAGSFLEYFLGDTKYGFISSLIEIMLIEKINLNFIFDEYLWNEGINTLRKYIELKYIVFINNNKLLDNKDFQNINEEICYLNKVIEINKFEINNENEKDSNITNNTSIKKRKELCLSDNTKKIDFSLCDDLSIDEIMRRYQDDNTNYEEKKLYKEFLLNRFERK